MNTKTTVPIRRAVIVLLAVAFALFGTPLSPLAMEHEMDEKGKKEKKEQSQQKAQQAQKQQKQKNPYARPDGTWISISGTVKSVMPDTFILDYDHGLVTVEMDDGDRDADAYKLIEGDKVTVNGRIDDDLYETTTIEAGSVYVEKLGTYFFASAMDEEGGELFPTIVTPVIVSSTSVWGTVTDVDGDEFTIDTGLRSLRVEVEDMPYDPLDAEGYQRIEVGDYVKVNGTMDHDFFEGRELVADTIVELVD